MIAAEGAETFETFQDFLAVAVFLAAEPGCRLGEDLPGLAR